MKNLTTIILLIIVSAVTGFSQSSDEKEILKFIADYDQAYINMDISFFEKNSVEEYTFSYDGRVRNRVQRIEDTKNELAKPTEKMLSWKTVSDSIHVVGNLAVASGSWTWSGVSLSNPNGEPHIDTGRYTLILEKRGGRWMIVAEHESEQYHDKKLMEAQVLKMGSEYNKAIERGNRAEIEKFLADEYLYTNEKGEVRNKAEDLATYKNRKSKIESAETTDQKVRVLGNNTAVETATIRFRVTDKDGKPFEKNERYTTTWVWRGLRWQIVADHSSPIIK